MLAQQEAWARRFRRSRQDLPLIIVAPEALDGRRAEERFATYLPARWSVARQLFVNFWALQPSDPVGRSREKAL